MDFLFSYGGLIVLVLLVVAVLVYRYYKGDPNALRAQFAIDSRSNPVPLTRAVLTDALYKAGFTNIRFDEALGTVCASSGFNIHSFGEKIEVTYDPSSSNHGAYHFLSVCSFPFQMVAWGKNQRNYKKFEAALAQVASA